MVEKFATNVIIKWGKRKVYKLPIHNYNMGFKSNILLGKNSIAVSYSSAIESVTSFNQYTNCCKAKVRYKKVCESCSKELTEEDIYKAYTIDKDNHKAVDTSLLEIKGNPNFKIMGTIENESIENNFIQDGTNWFVVPQKDMGEENTLQFAYLQNSLKESGKCFLCVIVVRKSEKIMMIKPYKKGFLACGIQFADKVRSIEDVSEYGMLSNINPKTEVITEMSRTLSQKTPIENNDFANRKTELVEMAITNPYEVKKINKQVTEKGKEKSELEMVSLVEF